LEHTHPGRPEQDTHLAIVRLLAPCLRALGTRSLPADKLWLFKNYTWVF
jgi:hypothetical protein